MSGIFTSISTASTGLARRTSSASLAAAGQLGPVPRELQRLAQREQDVLLVIDDEHGGGIIDASGPRPRGCG